MDEKDAQVDREIEKLKYKLETMKNFLEETLSREKLYIERE